MATNTGIEANTEAWLEAREGYLSASDIATVLGVNKWKTWEELRSGFGNNFTQEELDKFRAGHAFEVALKSMWGDIPGREVSISPSTLWASGNLAATPDGFGLNEHGEEGLIEAKFVGWRMLDFWENGPPLYVYLQVQGQMICTGTPFCYVVAALGGPGYNEWKVQADLNVQALILEAADAYMNRGPDASLQKAWVRRLDQLGFSQPPEKKWDSQPGKTLTVDATHNLSRRLADAWGRRALVNKEYDQIVNQIQELMQDAETLQTDEGRVVATWKTAMRRSLDYKKLRSILSPVELRDAYKETSSRTFLVKGSK